VADLDAENALWGILSRHESLEIRPLKTTDVDIHRHIQRDSGCYGDAENFLRPFLRTHRHALVVFDRHGCGCEDKTVSDIESDVEDRLTRSGWEGRCRVVVIDPELEAWVWSDSPHVDSELGWTGGSPELRQWLVSKGLVARGTSKPADPKKAVFAALSARRKPPSARLFRSLAERVGVDRCTDRSFLKLKNTLRTWFSPT